MRNAFVVAGGAYGIEAAAHRAVLAASGQTVAVQANGLDRRFPSGNGELLNRVGDVGLLLSELPPGTTPTRNRFIARNRLMAALSGATVIPEASVRSGSITTVLQARDLGRGIGAVPGPVTSAASTGSNQPIKQGIASLITEASDVRELLDADRPVGQTLGRSEITSGFEHRRESPGSLGPSL
ncbi:DNA-processing protein DprA [Gordonia sp. ABSL11-1]|uniref:DNA-processing protein DprA n=1 Tax=Gordonia sp. ABSL11-1 TaxID=3053924 RepID=UPI0033657093